MLNLIGIIEKKNEKNNLSFDAEIDEMNCWLSVIMDIKKYKYNSSIFLSVLNMLKNFRKSFQDSLNNNTVNIYRPGSYSSELEKRIKAIDFLINYLEGHKWEISN